MLLLAAIVGGAFAPGAYALDTGVDEVAVAVEAAVGTATSTPAAVETPVVVDTPPPPVDTTPADPTPVVDTPSRAAETPAPPVDTPPADPPVIQEPVAASTPDPVAPPPPPDPVPTVAEPTPAPADPVLSVPLDTNPPPPIDTPIVVPVDIAPAADVIGPSTGIDVAPATGSAGDLGPLVVTSEPTTPATGDTPVPAPADPFTPSVSVPIVQPLSVLIDLPGSPLTIISGTEGRPFLPSKDAQLVVQETPPTEATPMLPFGPFGPIMSSGDGPGSSRVAGLLALFMGLNPFAPQDGKAGSSPPPTLAVLVLGSVFAAFAFMMFPLRDRRRSGPRGYAALALRPG